VKTNILPVSEVRSFCRTLNFIVVFTTPAIRLSLQYAPSHRVRFTSIVSYVLATNFAFHLGFEFLAIVTVGRVAQTV
jgi:hypothetical protein